MTIEQTVEIPADHRLTLEVPREIPEGRAVIAFTPASADLRSVDFQSAAPAGETPDDEWQKTLAVLKGAHGAWKDKPWTTHLEDIRAMREEWDHRDPWKPGPAKRRRGDERG
jgi:hypothetical protein